jgi:RNA-directed DNA polymerase
MSRRSQTSSIVAKKPANKPETAEVDLWGGGAELVEPRGGTEGNTGEQHMYRTPSRASVSQGLERVREAARKRKKERFTALLHHVTIDLLKDAYSWLKRAAPSKSAASRRSTITAASTKSVARARIASSRASLQRS